MDSYIREIEKLEDGSSVYAFDTPANDQNTQAGQFHANLANELDDNSLKKLSSFLLESIDEDIESRKAWMDTVEKVKAYLGFSLEDLEKIPFSQATRTFDTTLATALIRFFAFTRAEVLPNSGPAGFQIEGQSTPELEQLGVTIRNWFNYYLTIVDKSYYPDFEKLLLYLGFYGSCFKKVYYDKSLEGPIARFILPSDFIIDNDCPSILESNRLTHVLHLSKREIILNQQNNLYRDVELSYLKSSERQQEDDAPKNENIEKEINIEAYSKRSLFPIYEVHTYLTLSEFSDRFNKDTEKELPLPYIVTIDKISKEILSIRRNWDENDPTKKRINYFVHYIYLPGFGIYGLGLAHLIGSNAITLTRLLRQLVDAGTFKNLPGGFRAKGIKQPKSNDLIVGPGEFVPVDTGGLPLSEAFMPLPYAEPSQVLQSLMLHIMEQTKELGSTSEMGMLDSKEDIPTHTAMAFLETNNRIQSAVLRSIHYSLSQELQLLNKIFKETISDKNFTFGGQQHEISSQDFVDEVKIIPVADPAINSTVQRIMRAQLIMEGAQQAPDLHNMREVFRLNYEAQGLDLQDIDKILLPDKEEEEVLPLDPITENINMLKGLPVKAAMWQAHPAHMLVHGLFAEENPDLKPQIMAHIREHEAYEYLIKMQQTMGIELPPLEQLEDPEIQNTIAMAIAEALNEKGGNQDQQPPPIDTNTLLMADIEQKAAEIQARERIANLKAETDVFKAQLDFEKEKAKIESAEDIAKLKSETELTKQEIANET